jgi:transposase
VTDQELDKNAARRLAIIRHAQQVTGNVALTCRYYGISRTVFYTWHWRYQAEGLAGLRDRSRRPQHCPHETPSEVVGKIIYLRQNYQFGPAKIAIYLKRYHDIEISASGVWRILKRVDLSRLPTYQRYQRHDRKWKRYEKPLPGHAVQVDVKFIARCPARARRSTTSSPPSTTAPGYGYCGSTTGSTRRPRSSSPTTCWTSSRCGSR